MIGYIKLAIAIINFLMQFLKYMEKAENSTNRLPLKKAKKFADFGKALEKAGKGDASDLEKMFTVIRPA